MPIYNPTIMVVPDGSAVQHPDTSEKTTISNRKSMCIGTTIYCINPR